MKQQDVLRRMGESRSRKKVVKRRICGDFAKRRQQWDT
jgi:hypothetical protein